MGLGVWPVWLLFVPLFLRDRMLLAFRRTVSDICLAFDLKKAGTTRRPLQDYDEFRHDVYLNLMRCQWSIKDSARLALPKRVIYGQFEVK